MKKRTIALILSLVLVLGCAVVGTLAWLQDKTDPVVNTFSPSTIDIELDENAGEENEYEFDMLPGSDIEKDPIVTVKANSEDCYLFVKVVESENFDGFMSYEIAEGWDELDGFNGVYYRVVETDDVDQKFPVLMDNKVTVSGNVTKDQMDALYEEGAELPTLTFTAYACQWENVADAATAWTNINTPATPAE